MAAQDAQHPLWDQRWQESEGERTIKKRSSDTAPVKLYCSWFCPFAQRAWIALEEKGIEYKYIEINPYEVDPEKPGGYTKKALTLARKRELYPAFLEASPRGLVPAVDHNGGKVWESLHVVAFLDEEFAARPLLPSDAVQRAHARIWAEHCTERIQKAFYTVLMAQDSGVQASGCEKFYNECRALANAMDPAGPFYSGKDFGFVDVALAPFWQRFLWIGEHYRGLAMPVDDPAFVRLHAWWEAASRRPSVVATLVSKDRLISSYSDYALNVGTSDYAKQMQANLTSKH